MIETIEIQKNRINYLKDKIAKLNKKARKLDCPEMTLTIGTVEKVVNVTNEFTGMLDRVEVFVDATLDYEIPIIDGWDLICTFDIVPMDEGSVVLTSKVPGKSIPIDWLNKTEIHCDHCGYNRNRNHSMLMFNIDTEDYMEVGSTCIKDFFGHDPKAFMWMAQISLESIVRNIESEFTGSSPYAYGLHDFLAVTNACINDSGWVSKGVAFDKGCSSTADMVLNQICPPRVDFRPKDWVLLPIVDDDRKMADNTVDYFLNLDVDDNDYLTNCKKIAEIGYVPVKHIGVACSMVATYKRSYEDKLRREAHGTSEYVGELGDKLEVAVECVFETTVNSQFGTSVLYIFVDKIGNKFKTFYSGSGWECETGDKVILKGTGKKHEEYKGEKATMLTRCNTSHRI